MKFTSPGASTGGQSRRFFFFYLSVFVGLETATVQAYCVAGYIVGENAATRQSEETRMGGRLTYLRIPILVCITMMLAAHVSASDDPPSSQSQNECAMSPREVVEQFIDLFYKKKKVRQAFENWVHPDYIQHKPTLPDGREAVVNFLENLLARFPQRIFTVHRIIASEDLVAVHYHSQASPEDSGFAVVDIFRVEGCLMVEHWDVVQPVPEDSANDNTMF